jgi:RND family efflux transporter MFP subunit
MRYHCDTLFCLLLTALLLGCEQSLPVAPPAVPKVTVSRPLQREVTDYEDFTGRTDAVTTVDIRARVTGYLIKVNFKDGDIVKEGDLLYEIDPRPFQAALDQAQGQVERLEANKKLLVVQVDRYTKLAAKGAGNQQDLDEYLAKQAENIGAMKAAQAQVDMANLNLGFTRVAAPINGRISRTLITPGNLVAADTTLLTTIKSVDPMYAYFNIEEPTVLRLQAMVRDGTIRSRSIHEVEVQMGLADDVLRKFPLRGTFDFVNNTIDPQTGTLQVRGVFPNPYALHEPPMLTPGLFVRVRMPLSRPHPVLLVTERAIGTDQGQKFVYVIGKDNQVGYRRAKLGLMFDGLQAIEEGLQPEDRVVVNGLQRIRPGIEVVAEDVDMASLAGPAQADPRPKGKPVDAKSADAKPIAEKTATPPDAPKS